MLHFELTYFVFFLKSAEYKGEYYRQHPVIKNFWEVFYSLSLDLKKKFLGKHRHYHGYSFMLIFPSLYFGLIKYYHAYLFITLYHRYVGLVSSKSKLKDCRFFCHP